MSADTPLHVGIDISSVGRLNRLRGVGIYVVGLLGGLAAIDRETRYTLFAYEPDPALVPARPANTDWAIVRPGNLGRATALLSHQLALPPLARRAGIDLLHSPYVPFNPSHPGPPLRQTVPTVVTLHDLTPLIYRERVLAHRRYRLFYRAMLRACRRARHLIADSRQTADDALRLGIARSPDAITAIPLAAQPPAPVAQPATPGLADLAERPFLLGVGGADYHKNQAGILDACAILRERDGAAPPLVLVGGHHLDHAAAERRSPGLGAQVRRHGGLPVGDLFWLYRHATALLFPSLYEGFGLPVLEAMGQGCPVVTGSRGATAEVAGDAALLVDPRDPVAIADAARRLLGDPALRADLAARGRARARAFSWERTARETLAIYRAVAGEG